MSGWDTYQSRINAYGNSKRNAMLLREQNNILRNSKNSLSHHMVIINGCNKPASITSTQNFNEKTICLMPGDEFDCGSIVEWADNYWLITDKDADNEVYTRGKMIQCNYLLHWVDSDHNIHEQWCIIEDGTKLRELVSVQRNLYVKISIELLETPKAHVTTT